MQQEISDVDGMVDNILVDVEPVETEDNEQSLHLVPDLRNTTRNHLADEQAVDQWTTFGLYMQEARERLKLTQKEAARRAGIKTNTWWRLENGKNGPQPETIAKIAAALEEDELTVYQKAGYNISQEAIKTTRETKQMGARLRTWREYRRQAPQLVASHLNIPLTEYLLYESGADPISAVLLKKAAEVINVPTNDLLHEGPILPPQMQDISLETVSRAELMQWQEQVLGDIADLKRLLIQIISRKCGCDPEHVAPEENFPS